jgi:hypothetical protein
MVVVLGVAVVSLVVVARCETGFDDIKWNSFVKEVVFWVEGTRKFRVKWSAFVVFSDNSRRPTGRHQIVDLFAVPGDLCERAAALSLNRLSWFRCLLIPSALTSVSAFSFLSLSDPAISRHARTLAKKLVI